MKATKPIKHVGEFVAVILFSAVADWNRLRRAGVGVDNHGRLIWPKGVRYIDGMSRKEAQEVVVNFMLNDYPCLARKYLGVQDPSAHISRLGIPTELCHDD